MMSENTPERGRDSMDDVIAVYRRGIDMTLIRQRLAMTVEQRCETFLRALTLTEELRRAGKELRDADRAAGHS